ncbi:MAG: putative toxin-antitoxin system toxin component, PIN family [bacterium]|nr:putative toxin-antitoxin system toxin component, PIN family [bacterium]
MKEEKKDINVVLDTNIFISALFWRGNPHKIISLALEKKIYVYTSSEILVELEKVLRRDFDEDSEVIERQISLVLEYATVIKPFAEVDIVKDDPDDNKIIACALTARADFIVSGDPHLFNIKEVFGIKILKPKDFLDQICP